MAIFRMTRIIMVVDLELPKHSWNLRETLMKVFLAKLLNGQNFVGKFETRKTNMHGIRLVFKSETDFIRTLEDNKNLPIMIEASKLEFEIQSKSDFASIFFVNWPMNKLDLFP